MHVCVVCHEASLTGAPRIGFDIAASLSERHQTTLLVKMRGPLIDLPRYAPLRDSYRCLDTSHQICELTYRERVDGAMSMLEALGPDVLYVNSVASGEWCEAGGRAGIPVALHTHETRDSLPGLLSTVCTPRILRWTDLLVGASRHAMEDIEELTGTSVRNRLDFGIFIDAETVLGQSNLEVPPPRNALGAALGEEGDGSRPVAAMCGLAQFRKGADIFFDAARRLPTCDFLWIGPWAPPETHDNGETLQRFKTLRLPNFYVTGLVDNPYAYMREMDAFVLTSREDPNPLVVAEALLLGKKVMAFADTGASAEILARFGYAFTGPPNAERIAGVLPGVFSDESGWRSGVAERVRREVDGSARLLQLETALEQLVGAAAGSA
ncbi:MAG: glycosyltransferase [Gammaproteobacteria bacterium]|nr:glycosyltransferase [Gammaproteobacteria bacterium]